MNEPNDIQPKLLKPIKKIYKSNYVEKTREQRQNDVRPIFLKLTELNLNITYDPVKKLYKLINEFVNDGIRQIIHIPFPEINRKIRGILSPNAKEESWVKLEVIE